MIILSTTDLSLRFGTTTVLENISFSINEGDRLGIIGVNGAGKTSLFRLITGEYKEMCEDDFRGILTLGGTILGTKRTPFKMPRSPFREYRRNQYEKT